MENIVVIGSSGHAKVVIDIIQKQGVCNICGLLDPFRAVGETTLGYSVLGAEADLPALASTYQLTGFIVAVGDNFVRSEIVARIKCLCPDLALVSAIHPSARIACDVAIGAGSVVMAGAIVNPSCVIGEGCIVNTAASLDHDARLGDFASLAPGVVTGGYCDIGRGAAINIGAVLADRITIGEHAVVGAGAVVLTALPANCVAYGSPARLIRSRQAGDKYI